MIFVDTGAFLARYLTRHSCHQAAVKIWRGLAGVSLYTTNHVLDETLSLLARRAGYEFAAERAEIFYSSTALEIVTSTSEDEREAVGWFRRLADQQVSFTDCVSFVIMKRYRIPEAFTFDRHFRSAGFRVIGLK